MAPAVTASAHASTGTLITVAPTGAEHAKADLPQLPTTLAELVGHTDAGFTLRVYAQDSRDQATIVSDVLARAAGANVAT